MTIRFVFVEIRFCKAEIDHVHDSRVAFQTHKEVVRLDVSVEHGLLAGLMEHFQTVNELYEEEDGGLETEPRATDGVQVSECWAK